MKVNYQQVPVKVLKMALPAKPILFLITHGLLKGRKIELVLPDLMEPISSN